MAIRDVNRKLAKIEPLAELVNNRDGYLYFTYWNPKTGVQHEKAVTVCYYKDYTDAEWFAMGEAFIKEAQTLEEGNEVLDDCANQEAKTWFN